VARHNVKGGNITAVNPGVFFYYTRVTGTAGDTVAITQSHTGSAPAIPIQQEQVLLYSDPGCTTLKWKTLSVTGGTATGTLPSTGSFIISVKYDTSSLKGKPAPVPPTSTYTFGTNRNGNPILADIARVDLVKKQAIEGRAGSGPPFPRSSLIEGRAVLPGPRSFP
jgi:hypothetical protein